MADVSAHTIEIHTQLTSELNTSGGNFKHLKEDEENILIETRKSRKNSIDANPAMSG